jgi:abortive infection bacteriophage resistance protein
MILLPGRETRKYRNVCAHHSRLWNRELAVKPELPVAWKANGIGHVPKAFKAEERLF